MVGSIGVLRDVRDRGHCRNSGKLCPHHLLLQVIITILIIISISIIIIVIIVIIISCCRSSSSSSSPAAGQTEIERLTLIMARLLWYRDLIVMRSMRVLCSAIFAYVRDGDNFCCFLFPFQAVSWGHRKVWRKITKIHVLAVSILSQNIPRPSPVWLTTRLYLVNIIQG